jgi:hypothetical protein
MRFLSEKFLVCPGEADIIPILKMKIQDLERLSDLSQIIFLMSDSPGTGTQWFLAPKLINIYVLLFSKAQCFLILKIAT